MEYSLKLFGKAKVHLRGSLENLRPSPESFENPPSPSCRRVEQITGQHTFDCRLLRNLEFLVKANHMHSAPSGALRAPLQHPQRPLEPSTCTKAGFFRGPGVGLQCKVHILTHFTAPPVALRATSLRKSMFF